MWVRALCILALIGTVAAADEDKDTARKEFAAGQAADKARKYAEAIEHYKKANELVPHPFAMFNIAADYERLGKLRESAEWYEKYLDSASTKEADREKVNRLLIELRNRPSQVQVNSNPDGARVIINGIPTGTTPYKGELKGGMYHVTVQRGEERDAKEITVEYGEPVNVQFAFRNATSSAPAVTNPPTETIRKPPPVRGASGNLVVSGEPIGALVAVDNVPIGTLPTTIPLEVGTHSVRITADGFSPYETTVSILAQRDAPVDARLSRALGALSTPTPSKIRVGYLIGGGGGADARGTGAIYHGEFGVRAAKYDLSARLGKVSDLFFVDLMARWTMTDSKLAPYIGGGYSFVSGGYGYVFFGGLRYDLSDGEKAGIALMVESGYRFYTGTSSDTTSMDTIEGSIVPIMASLLIRYR